MKKYSSYKTSNIDWIGVIPQHWNFSKIIYYAKLRTGGTPNRNISEYWENGTINWMSSGEVNKKLIYEVGNKITELGFKNSNATLLPINSVMIALNGQGKTKGTVAILRIETTCNQSLAGFICDESKLYSRYLYYFLDSKYKELRGLVGDESREGLSLGLLKTLYTLLPPIEEQILCVKYLDKVIEKVDVLLSKKQKLINLLKEQRTAIINHVVTKGINPNVEMKASGIKWLNQVPKNWEICPLFTLLKEHKYKNKENLEKNVLSLSYGNIVKRNIADNFGLLPESFEGYNIVQVGNIVLRLTDLQNDHKSLRCGLVKEKGIITSAYTTIECSNSINSDYAYYLLHVYDLLKVFYGMGGGVRQSIDYIDLKKMPILLPPYEVQVEIAKYIKSKVLVIDKSIKNMLIELNLLQEYRIALISEVVTGKIDVRQEVLS